MEYEDIKPCAQGEQMSEEKLWHHASARDNWFVNPHFMQSADGIGALIMMRRGSSISEVRGYRQQYISEDS